MCNHGKERTFNPRRANRQADIRIVRLRRMARSQPLHLTRRTMVSADREAVLVRAGGRANYLKNAESLIQRPPTVIIV
ncbi:Hypothetical protein NTJ_02165 [Nesidiocoris tenuis]|uniref:Uncharacterized protein n=1 Tax=Nesidiocoris tenuis TaxID=355587 RepID=A0ABN7ABF2_9HEMI|nr:Hypothetical protein NTJ_02165 [Nesidiocoris tenuis]